jgi:hypothetical protein
MSTYSDLKIELIGTGEQDGTWGTTTNTNLGTALEEMITGSADVTFASATQTLTLSNTNATQVGRNLRLNLIGTSGGPQDLVLPATEKFYLVNNATADIITCKNASGTTVAIPAGVSQFIFNTGSNVSVANTYHSGAGVFTTLSASGLVSGAGFTARFATPGPIGNTAPSTGAFTTLSATGNVTLGDAVGDQVTFNAGTAVVPNNLIFSGTGTITTPSGTTAQRPGSPGEGMLRYNSELDEFEGYANSAWGSIGGGASAGGAIYENTQTITANYTMTTGTNGHSVGPITINSGIVVTIPSGSSWLVSI